MCRQAQAANVAVGTPVVAGARTAARAAAVRLQPVLDALDRRLRPHAERAWAAVRPAAVQVGATLRGAAHRAAQLLDREPNLSPSAGLRCAHARASGEAGGADTRPGGQGAGLGLGRQALAAWLSRFGRCFRGGL